MDFVQSTDATSDNEDYFNVLCDDEEDYIQIIDRTEETEEPDNKTSNDKNVKLARHHNVSNNFNDIKQHYIYICIKYI